MNRRGEDARNRTATRPPTPAPQHSRASTLLLPISAAVVGLGIVVGAALSGPWNADPRDLAELPAPEVTMPVVEDLGEFVPPPEPSEPDGGFPLMVWLVIAGLIVLFLALRAFLSRVSFRRGETEGRYEAEAGRIDQVEALETEPDLPALRRGVEAARRILDGHDAPDDAIIAAWLELEKAAASSGVDRARSDTPTEFTTAVLDATKADPAATRTLLGLYHRARFAPHAVLGPAEVAQAVSSLERIAESWRER